jgi:hypothetical protein
MNIMKNSETNNIQSHSRNTMLCDGFLIPMTDFVNNVGNMENYPSHENALSWIYNYATFLKKPLKLEMFAPCDEDGNVLEEPKIEEEYVDEHTTQIFAQYQYDLDKAKEKVLFEHKLQFDLGVIRHHISQGRNIEYFANFGSMQLTKTALNAIFG